MRITWGQVECGHVACIMRDCLLEVTPLKNRMVPVSGARTLELGGCLHPVLWQEESHSCLWHKERVGDGVLMDSAIIVLPSPKDGPLLDVGDLGSHESHDCTLGRSWDINKIFNPV